MELFDSVYSFWALALVLLCAGNGLFFLTCSKHPKWPWRQAIPVPISTQKRSKRRKKKDSSRVQVFKDKERPKRDSIQKDTEGDLSSDVELTASKQETMSGSESPTSSGPTKADRKEVARIRKEAIEALRSPKDFKEPELSERHSVGDQRQEEVQTQASSGAGKKHRKKKGKKSAASSSSSSAAAKPVGLDEQRSDQESGEGWFLVSSGGKAKVSKATGNKNVASNVEDLGHQGNSEKRGTPKRVPVGIDSKPQEMNSLVDVFDLSLAELKERESRYHREEKSPDPSLEKIINARIVDIQQNNESNGFAASAAVASVHHLKQTLMGDGKASRPNIDMSQPTSSGQFAHQQLAYEHQIRTSEIQREFMRSAGNLGPAAWARMDPVSCPVERFPFMSAGQSCPMTAASWAGETVRPRYGQAVQSSFEFVSQGSLADPDKLTSIECDEGSIAFRRHEGSDFADRPFDRVESRISDTTEEEYSVIDTIMSSEFSRQNNSSGSIVDVVEESMHHEFSYDDDRAANDEGFDDIDLIDEYSMAALAPACPKPPVAPVANQEEMNSSLTFHGREHLIMGGPPQHHISQPLMQHSNIDQPIEKPVRVEPPGDGCISSQPPPPVGTPMSMPFRYSWMPAGLVYSCADQIRNGFPTYRTHRQLVMLEAMRAVQAAFDMAAAQRRQPQPMSRQVPSYFSGRPTSRQSQIMRGAT